MLLRGLTRVLPERLESTLAPRAASWPATRHTAVRESFQDTGRQKLLQFALVLCSPPH